MKTVIDKYHFDFIAGIAKRVLSWQKLGEVELNGKHPGYY